MIRRWQLSYRRLERLDEKLLAVQDFASRCGKNTELARNLLIDALLEAGEEVPAYMNNASFNTIMAHAERMIGNRSEVQERLYEMSNDQRPAWMRIIGLILEDTEILINKPTSEEKRQRALLVGGLGGSFPAYRRRMSDLGWQADHSTGIVRCFKPYKKVLVAGQASGLMETKRRAINAGAAVYHHRHFSIKWIEDCLVGNAKPHI